MRRNTAVHIATVPTTVTFWCFNVLQCDIGVSQFSYSRSDLTFYFKVIDLIRFSIKKIFSALMALPLAPGFVKIYRSLLLCPDN